MKTKRIVDILMTASMMLLMSMQITEQEWHEYIGVFMFALVLLHMYLNRIWYKALFKGRYSLLRSFGVVVNFALLAAFFMSVFSGIIMSESFPALNVESLTSFARVAHLSSSYLCFVLMAVHAGLYWGMIAGKIKALWPVVLAVIVAGWGLYAFLDADIFSYITLRNQFAFVDYDKNFALVLLDNISMFVFWTLVGYQVTRILSGKYLRPCVIIFCVLLMGVSLYSFCGTQSGGF
ncbi:MAG: DUF4405 domain-containing protein [Synergistaceae bacterium]|nr:DUF4405 domain-containing protein [Synergistaceae bacterium]